MKVSKYNSFISLKSGQILIYNAFARRFALINEKVFKQILRFAQEKSGATSSFNVDIFAQLKSVGVLIEDNVDEVAILIDEIRKNDFNMEHLEININPTLDCNFKCWYCYENHISKSEMSADVIESVKRYIDQQVSKSVKSLNLTFFGGEPLLKFTSVCRPLIEYAHSVCSNKNIHFHVGVTTNAYLVDKPMAEFFSSIDCGMQITLDGHRPFHNKVRVAPNGNSSYDVILNNVAMLANHNVRIVLRINYTLGNIVSVQNIVDDLINLQITIPSNITVDFQRVWQDIHNKGDEKIKSLIAGYGKQLRDAGFFYSMPDLLNHRVNSCYGDRINYVCINYNGDFYKCTARDFTKANREGYLESDGNLVWENGHYDRWCEAKFNRRVCHDCRIAPICLGGCRRKNLEMPDNEQCPLGYDDARKDELILQRFEAQFM